MANFLCKEVQLSEQKLILLMETYPFVSRDQRIYSQLSSFNWEIKMHESETALEINCGKMFIRIGIDRLIYQTMDVIHFVTFLFLRNKATY